MPGPGDDGGTPPFQEGVGEILRCRRESYGQDLPTVASQLHIRPTYLRAVETGRFKDLPGMAYASGFVRSYGDYLGLDGEELVRLFREEVAGVDRQSARCSDRRQRRAHPRGGGAAALGLPRRIGLWRLVLSGRPEGAFATSFPSAPQLRAILGKEVPVNVATAPPVVKPQGATPPRPGRRPPPRPPRGSTRPASGPAPPPQLGGGRRPRRPLPAQRPARRASTIASQHATLPVAPAALPSEPQAPATSVLVEPDDPAPLPGEFNALSPPSPRAPTASRFRRPRRSSWLAPAPG